MACNASCIYRSPISIEIAAATAKTTADHAFFAVALNVLAFLTLAKLGVKEGNIRMSAFQGLISAFMLNGTHLLAHHVIGKEKGETQKIVKLALVFFVSVYCFPSIAERFDKEVTFYEAFRYGAFSCVGISLYNLGCLKETI